VNTERPKNQVIDQMNEDKENFVILQPGQVWTPGIATETKVEDGPCTFHVWHKVELFTSTVEECKKCGKLKETITRTEQN
jgi:hypothetical protein